MSSREPIELDLFKEYINHKKNRRKELPYRLPPPLILKLKYKVLVLSTRMWTVRKEAAILV